MKRIVSCLLFASALSTGCGTAVSESASAPFTVQRVGPFDYVEQLVSLSENGDSFVGSKPTPIFGDAPDPDIVYAKNPTHEEFLDDPAEELAKLGWTYNQAKTGVAGTSSWTCTGTATKGLDVLSSLDCATYKVTGWSEPAVRVCQDFCQASAIFLTASGQTSVPPGVMIKAKNQWLFLAEEYIKESSGNGCAQGWIVVRELNQTAPILRERGTSCGVEVDQFRADRQDRWILEWDNKVWIDGQPLTEKYGLDSALGFSESGGDSFFGRAIGETQHHLHFEGKPLSPGYDEVRYRICCAPDVPGIQGNSNGFRFYAKRGEQWLLAEYRRTLG